MKRYKISHYNGARCADELVIYNIPGETGTNAYGCEAVVENGIVVKFGSNNNVVPDGGFVISGHGKAALVVGELCEGAKIAIDEKTGELCCTVDDDSRLYGANKKLVYNKERFENLISKGCAFDVDAACEAIENAAKAIDAKNVADAEKWVEEGYYLTAESKKGEIRAIWHRPHEKTADAIDATVKRLKDAGFNMLLVETNYEGWANAKKVVYDWLPLSPKWAEVDFDPIEEFIKAGKKYGVEIHAWLEDFFIGVKDTGCRMFELHPELMAYTKDGGHLMDGWDIFYFLNPALDEVHDLLEKEYRDLLDNYDFDGIQLDYIRYPVIKDIYHSAGFEDVTKKMFFADTGIDVDSIPDTNHPDWASFNKWRAAKITKYVNRIVDMVNEYKAKGRKLALTSAVFGDPDEAIRLKCQDWQKWVKNGWLDMIFPMAYLNDADDVYKEIKYMVDNYGESPNISGISPMYSHLPVIESTKQVEACRRAGASGVAFFETLALTDVQIDKLKKGVFRD